MPQTSLIRLGLLAVVAGGWPLSSATVWGQAGGRSPVGVVQTGPQSPGVAPGSGGASVGGVSPATGQAAAPATGQLPRPQVELQEDPRIDQILRAWEHYTRNIDRLHGSFERYVYDGTYLVEKRSAGEFWYEKPDKGRLDCNPFPEARMPPPNDKGQRVNVRKTGANGAPYTVMQDTGSRWICRGDALLFIHVDQKIYDVTEIPAHMQGQNITQSPLPFLFGVAASEMKRKFYLSVGTMHDPDGKATGRPLIHLVAAPRLASLAQEFSRAEVLLDPGTILRDGSGQPVFAPFAIRLFDPTGQSETVYQFDIASTKLNQLPLLFGNPFREPSLIQGYRLNQHNRAAANDDPNQRSAEAPAARPQQGLLR